MIFIHQPIAGPGHILLDRRPLELQDPIPDETVWLDMIRPTREEDLKVEAFMGISVPTREEMKDIEPSELLYVEDGARYMTGRVLSKVSDADEPGLAGITFILRGNRLVTVRYEEPQAFRMYTQRAGRSTGNGPSAAPSGETILAGLIETVIDRAADVLQLQGERIDRLSGKIFEEKADPSARNTALQDTLRALGRLGDLISKQRESLVSMERILLSLSATYRTTKAPRELREDVRSTLRDLQSLEEHATFLSSKIQFLLDATLGLVNLEQNNIIKLFSVMAVVFMPPTLIASIYGMNFKAMPELDWTFGYPMAVVMMVVAAVLPYVFFRWKKWL
ncbi:MULTISPECIES: magnesium transporter CorA family protein [Methylobacterium]|uniref:Magnesium transport protein CorA n=1 Tax=Methylobacterium bullatum TaxID=570505 RepID=A0A679JWZ3_9HYPH|nr:MULTISPECIES: magnesium transporter CorA family protein [Methylobacterium]KQO45952.1 magnesium transporter [Methylobacterium sp. Leaf85]KQP53393.1 magnesium transporter [Methylobacterium sp. Leaf106]MBD8901149.1 magnesium transporter [Methylobacterium bullatum]MCC0805347.1 magnesium transporter [Methylobacterium sp. W2]TXN26520.1 magnesium transporter CorA family protein [Methylobacterium sp. WL19]